ncbi:anthranilate phosphoribosyltransferase [Psychrosphaera haliotis]|uniref:Anthranilate phosphoribosyltransferase n=1 Tax=Psychrosphaera haliotis TaxID=555083 RepID=A0A6N8F592_9GAMM|nr:anthranilate phosphoribosyltransferase [Psychrosphaera haliotis]MUH71725.1 anthranilate phosphoribosyltransferase [Psychrosphaera haliotis]
MNTVQLDLIHLAMTNRSLTKEQTYKLFTDVVNGEMEDIPLAALLSALKVRGETPEEIAGAAMALADNAIPFPDLDFETIDNCGTGGDGTNTINISTLCAIVAASMGLKMAKHGNRKVSSSSGSADVLSELGVPLDMTPEVAKKCLVESNLTFLMAPHYHRGIKHAMPVRNTLRTRTIFNALGPLVNPAKAKTCIIGVYDADLCRPMAESLKLLGKDRAWVVHGAGMDEIAVHDKTKVVQLIDGKISEFYVSPEDFGQIRYTIKDLVGGDPAHNARIIRKVLAGEGEAAHNAAVILNTAPLLVLTGQAESLMEAAKMVEQKLLSGSALDTLEHFVTIAKNG